MRKIKIFPCPNVEVKIHLTDEMIKEWIACDEACSNYDENGEAQFADCDNCSWNNKKFGGVGLCIYDEVREKMKEVVNGEQE